MLEEKFCVPCQKLLCEERIKTPHNVHHPHTQSLEESLKLPCSICTLLWEDLHGMHKPTKLPSTVTYFTTRGPMLKDRELCFNFDEQPVSLYIAPSDALRDYPLTDTISDSTKSESSLRFLYQKYKECQENHVECRPSSNLGVWYPKRVIDVGEYESDSIHLRNGNSVMDQGGYFTLSHCWGNSHPMGLTQNTAAALYNGVPLTKLPKTFQDAVFVARGFKVKYLWIDSLCIFQDDIDDWSIEASSMKDVYSRAACNIAATTAVSSNGGLFFARNPLLLRPICIQGTWKTTKREDDRVEHDFPPPGQYWLDRFRVWPREVEEAPLNSRAWVFQERHLSLRIMHFGESQVFWECKRQTTSEVYPGQLPYWVRPSWSEEAGSLKRYMARFQSQRPAPAEDMTGGVETLVSDQSRSDLPNHQMQNGLYHHWGVFRAAYTACKMTKEEDKLVAISGIAKEVAEVLNDTLIAGLWRNRIVEELCWFKWTEAREESPPPPRKWRAPSWSWASTNGRIRTSVLTRMHLDCPGRLTTVELHDLDVKTKPSGALMHACMAIKCKPISISFKCEEKLRGLALGVVTFLRSRETFRVSRGLLESVDFILDDPIKESKAVQQLYLVLIRQCLSHGNREESMESCLEGLLLKSQPEDNNALKRIGYFKVNDKPDQDFFDRVCAENEYTDSRIVKLV